MEATARSGLCDGSARGLLVTVSAFSVWWRNQSVTAKIGWVIVALMVISLMLIAYNTFASVSGG